MTRMANLKKLNISQQTANFFMLENMFSKWKFVESKNCTFTLKTA